MSEMATQLGRKCGPAQGVEPEKAELMEITSGEVEILLAGQPDWQTIRGSESFNVDANSSFQIKVNSVTDYCCSYLD